MTVSDAAALLLDPGMDANALAWLQDDLMPHFADRDFAVIVKDMPDIIAATGLDGLHLSDATGMKKLRGQFSDISIGVACPLERHEAMDAAELGADYIAFDATGADMEQLLPLIHWWGEMMTVPSVVFAETPEMAQALAKAGADFIGIGASVWRQAEPLKAMDGFVKALAG
jgi:thiamine-phosphate pyrophosphorylase